jgi:hypothetical protein
LWLGLGWMVVLGRTRGSGRRTSSTCNIYLQLLQTAFLRKRYKCSPRGWCRTVLHIQSAGRGSEVQLLLGSANPCSGFKARCGFVIGIVCVLGRGEVRMGQEGRKVSLCIREGHGHKSRQVAWTSGCRIGHYLCRNT